VLALRRYYGLCWLPRRSHVAALAG